MKNEYTAEIGEYNDSVSAYYEEEEEKEIVLTRYSRCNQLYNQFQSQHSANKSTFGIICDNFCVTEQLKVLYCREYGTTISLSLRQAFANCLCLCLPQ